MRKSIFVVEAKIDVRCFVRHSLERAGYSVREFPNAAMLEEIEARRPSLVLIDANLLGDSGPQLCRCLRQNSLLAATRIVLLLAGDGEEERMAGLDAGADDCISKPFSAHELVFRVQTVLRGMDTPAPSLEPTDIEIDRAAMKISIHGHEVITTSLEFRLLDYLALHRGRVCTRDALLDAVWGEVQFVMPQSVDACIRRLRDKIEPNRARPTYLKTVRGLGYRFDANAVWPTSNGDCTCRVCSASTGPSGIAYARTLKSGRPAAQVQTATTRSRLASQARLAGGPAFRPLTH
jgi:DNA-binding response OmpR family regulator